MATPLTDGFGREFTYLRLSLEDACNFRCLYCLPGGWHRAEEQPPLAADELGRLARAFAGMGFWKFRLTGGEPTVRRDIIEAAAAVAGTEGIRKVALSTNGFRLAALAGPLREAGVTAVNVSVDSLDPERFRRITGHDALGAVRAGIDRCLELGYDSVKVNVVLLKDINDGEVSSFLEWTRQVPVDVRFIELMPTADNEGLFRASHLSAQGLRDRLAAEGWREEPRPEGAGPARLFRRTGHAGGVGLIAPYSKDFCASCNRLRVTSRGGLRLCLFAEADLSLRHLLRGDGQLGELQETVRGLLARKEVSHYLPEGRLGNVRHFAAMGG